MNEKKHKELYKQEQRLIYENKLLQQEDLEIDQEYLRDEQEKKIAKFLRKKERFENMIYQWAFRKPIGSVLKYENRMLEMVKFISHALSLDHIIKEPVRIMKKNCLKILKICKDSRFINFSLFS